MRPFKVPTLVHTVVLALVLSMSALAAISVTPNAPACDAAVCLAFTGDDSSQNAIDEVLKTAGIPLPEKYKQDTGTPLPPEGGVAAAWYTTTFNADGSGGSITWDGPGYISGIPTYLLVKDGKQIPAWYLFELNTWNGQVTIDMSGFWPENGAISHVSIYGASVPDGGMTVVLLGGALVGLETLRRRLRA